MNRKETELENRKVEALEAIAKTLETLDIVDVLDAWLKSISTQLIELEGINDNLKDIKEQFQEWNFKH